MSFMRKKALAGVLVASTYLSVAHQSEAVCHGEAQYRVTCTIQNIFTPGNVAACVQELCNRESVIQPALAAFHKNIIKIFSGMGIKIRSQPIQNTSVPTKPEIMSAYEEYKHSPTLENWGKLVAHIPDTDEQEAVAFVDPISLTFMQNPYRLEGTQFVFEHDEIMTWVAKCQSTGKAVTNPYTNEPMDFTQLKLDLELKKKIEAYVFEKLGITNILPDQP